MHNQLTTTRMLTSMMLLAILLTACTSGGGLIPVMESTATMTLTPLPTHLPTQTPVPYPVDKLFWNLALTENETGSWCDLNPIYAKGYNWARQMIIDAAQGYQVSNWNPTGQFGVEYKVNGRANGSPNGVEVAINQDGTVCVHVNQPVPAGDYAVEIVYQIDVFGPVDFPLVPEDSRYMLVKVMPPVDLSRAEDDILAVTADGVLLFDATQMTMTRLATGSYPLGPDWSPDGMRLAWFDGAGAGKVFLINADGSGQNEMVAGTFDPDWSPDGSRIAFTYYAGVAVPNSSYGSIQVANPDGSGAVSLAEGSNPQWSPTANEIAYLLNNGLWLVGTDGGAPRLLTDDISVPMRTAGQSASREFAWSPDGSRIAYLTQGVNGVPGYLAAVPRDGSTPVRLADLAQYLTSVNGASMPVWSPDGNHIALNCGNLCIVGMDGSVRMVPVTMWISSLSWSRDGTRVYISMSANEVDGIQVYDLAGGMLSPVLASDLRGITGVEVR
jgi:Tol biopolymer transport system component